MKILLVVLLALPLPALAIGAGDGVVVHFKDGAKVSGVLVSIKDEKITIQVAGAKVGWLLQDVLRLEARRTDIERFQELEKSAGKDREKIQKAARFARSHGLHTDYHRLVDDFDLTTKRPRKTRRRLPLIDPFEPREETSSHGSPPPRFGFGAGPKVHRPGRVRRHDHHHHHRRVYPVPVYVRPRSPITATEQAAFLKKMEKKRETFRRTPQFSRYAEFQFRIEEAHERRRHGLSFTSKPF